MNVSPFVNRLMNDDGENLGVRILIAGLLFAAACAQPTLFPTSESTPGPVELANPTADLIPTATSVPTLVPTATPTPEPERSPARSVRLEITEGSEARYLVKEQFARRSVPNDAIGKTREVTGAIRFDGGGAVETEESILRVDLSALRSDEDDRDDYLRGESLESDQFPIAEFVVIETPGLPWPLPLVGEVNFQIQGDMTIHDTTSPLVWEVTAHFAADRIVGTAKTNFDFARFHLVRPTRFFLLSVEDNIRLELDFVVSVTELVEEQVGAGHQGLLGQADVGYQDHPQLTWPAIRSHPEVSGQMSGGWLR